MLTASVKAEMFHTNPFGVGYGACTFIPDPTKPENFFSKEMRAIRKWIS